MFCPVWNGNVIQLILGPCELNQNKLALSEALVAIKTVVSLPPQSKEKQSRQNQFPEEDLTLRASALKVIKSCLEGRADLKVHNAVSVVLQRKRNIRNIM